MMRYGFAFLFSILFVVLASPAGAQGEPSAAEIAVARKRFAEANDLEKEKKWAEAEVKLREAMAIKETAGLRYHLGFCLEQQGKLVEALVEYDRADELIARGAKAPDVAEMIGPARDGVKKRVGNLTIKLPSDVTEAKVEVDGAAVKPALVGKPLPQNPGHHVVTASAPGRQAFRVEVTLSEGQAEDVEVSLPKLGETTPQKAAPATTERLDQGTTASTSGMSTRTIVLIAEGAVTAIGLGTGLFFTIKKSGDQKDIDDAEAEIDKTSTSSDACKDPALKDPCAKLSDALDKRETDKSLATIGFVGAGVGAAAMVLTFVLWKPKQQEAVGVRVAPSISPKSAGLTVLGRF